MNRLDEIKLRLTRGWQLPGKLRLARQVVKPASNTGNSYFDGISWFENEDICIYTNTKSYVEWELLSTGSYENELLKLLTISLKLGDVALDVGANIGIQSIRMSKLVGQSGKVLSVEPVEHIRKALSRNLSLNRVNNVTVFPFALSNFNGSTFIHVNEEAWNQGTASLTSDTGQTSNAKSIEVKKGDTLIEEMNLSQLDLIKIDVEGFEFPVLQGLSGAIGRFTPRIIFEYDLNYWKRSKTTFEECARFLEGFGYSIYGVFDFGAEVIKDFSSPNASNIFCLKEK